MEFLSGSLVLTCGVVSGKLGCVTEVLASSSVILLDKGDQAL
jgi:hypothetical protein